MITFTVSQQVLTRTDTERVVADSQNHVKVKFTLDEEWAGLTVTAVFQNGNVTRALYNVVSGTAVVLPWELLHPGNMHVYLEGYDGELRLTTARLDKPVRVYPSGRIPWTSLRNEPSPSLYEQLVADCRTMKSRIDAQGDDLTALTGRTSASESAITGLQSDVTALSGRVTSAESSVSSLGGRVDTVESTVSSFNSRVSAAETAITGLDAEQDALNIRVGSAETMLTDHDNHLISLETRVTELSGAITVDKRVITDPTRPNTSLKYSDGTLISYGEVGLIVVSSFETVTLSGGKSLYTMTLIPNVTQGTDLFAVPFSTVGACHFTYRDTSGEKAFSLTGDVDEGTIESLVGVFLRSTGSSSLNGTLCYTIIGRWQ